MIDIRTGRELTRRDFGKGLAAILAAGCAPYAARAGFGLRHGIGLRSAAWSKALPYDAEVEYIESTTKGYQIIDTGFKVEDNSEVIIDVGWKPGSVETDFCGTRDMGYVYHDGSLPDHGTAESVILGNYSNFVFLYALAQGRIDSETYYLKQRRVISFGFSNSKKFLYIDGNLIGLNTSQLPLGKNLFLFTGGGFENGLPYRPAAMKLYSLKCFTNGTLLRDMKPVRLNANGCLYDMRGVGGMNSNKSPREDGIYFNVGENSFVIGPDKT